MNRVLTWAQTLSPNFTAADLVVGTAYVIIIAIAGAMAIMWLGDQ